MSGAFKIKFSSFISFKLSVCLFKVNILIETRSACPLRKTPVSLKFPFLSIYLSPAVPCACNKLWWWVLVSVSLQGWLVLSLTPSPNVGVCSSLSTMFKVGINRNLYSLRKHVIYSKLCEGMKGSHKQVMLKSCNK